MPACGAWCSRGVIRLDETIILKGVIHGRTIELDHEPGLPEGQFVSVVLRSALPRGEGLRRSFGAWASDASELNEFIEGIYRDREDHGSGATP